jgi:tRNA modification GTPase
MSTIYALATPPGRAGVAVIRISGPNALAAVERMAGPLPSPRRAGLRRLRGEDGTVIDEAVVLPFPDERSYTGEPVVELQCHGSPAVVRALLGTLAASDGLRPAEPGEFTRRALVNGRMELSQVEGLADLIDAETEAQRVQAWRSYDREATAMVEAWRTELRRALALLEAVIDFSDQDVPDDVAQEVQTVVAGVLMGVRREISGIGASARLRDGYAVAIMGAPNTGKSTLLNYLAGREVALTSPVPGTTRDVLEVRTDLGGLPVSFLDTAGLRETDDEIERMGAQMAMRRGDDADLRVILLADRDAASPVEVRPGDVVLVGKSDLGNGDISGVTGDGVQGLLSEVRHRLSDVKDRAALFNRHRHETALKATESALEGISGAFVGEEVMAHHLWRAIDALGHLIGATDIEELLDDVFSSFCIGK